MFPYIVIITTKLSDGRSKNEINKLMIKLTFFGKTKCMHFDNTKLRLFKTMISTIKKKH